MDERHPLIALTGGAADAMNSFLGRNAQQGVEMIRLPRGDFMLRADKEVFSSLEPFNNPRVVNFNYEGDFYDHGNYIISTVGLNPATGEMRPSVHQLGVALVDNYGLNFKPEDFQENYLGFLRATAGESDRRYLEGGDGEFPTHQSLVWDWMTRSSDRYPRPEDVAGEGYWLRDVEEYPNMLLHQRGEDRNALFPPGVPEDLRRILSESKYLYAPAGAEAFSIEGIMKATENMTGFGGILQAQLAGGNHRFNAYMFGKQIVPHPHQIIPSKTTYPFYYLADGLGQGELKVPWDRREEVPTRILNNIHLSL